MNRGRWETLLHQHIDALFPDIVSLRQHLHRHPELSGEEQETSLHLYQLLGDLGFQVRLGVEGRGVIADLSSSQISESAGRVCLRADIDALQIHDEKDAPYCSTRPGIMHACGHDAHSAMVYGACCAVLRLLESPEWSEVGGTLQRGFRAIFQPAEEICRGAKEMIEIGALDQAERILGVHVDPSRQVGTIGIRKGVITASCDELLFDVRGAGGHGARPHEAVDPITAAAHLIQVLYKYIPRVTDSQDAVVFTIGRIQGGRNSNVIPAHVELGGTLRTLDEHVREETIAHIRRLTDGVGHISGTKISYKTGMSVPSVVNDEQATKTLDRSAQAVLDLESIQYIPRPSMGSEDFAYYVERVPGAMFRLGSASARVGNSPLHTPLFDVDDEALRIGSKILAHAVISSMME